MTAPIFTVVHRVREQKLSSQTRDMHVAGYSPSAPAAGENGKADGQASRLLDQPTTFVAYWETLDKRLTRARVAGGGTYASPFDCSIARKAAFPSREQRAAVGTAQASCPPSGTPPMP